MESRVLKTKTRPTKGRELPVVPPNLADSRLTWSQ